MRRSPRDMAHEGRRTRTMEWSPELTNHPEKDEEEEDEEDNGTGHGN